MANQVTVSNNNTINVTVEPPANVQVQVSRAVIGTVANVASANLANYVIQNSQPNITSVGTLTGLTSSGNIIAPFFIGNVVGNISGNLVVPGTNTAILFNQAGNAGASDALKFDYAANVLTANGNIVANYYSGNGSQLTGVIAVSANYANFANVSNIANSVAVSNVSGIGNIATINLDGNAGNILYGNGIFAAAPDISNIANANYANFAGDVVNSSQPNITSLGTLTGLVVGGDITPNSNVTHSLGNNTNRFNDLYLAGNTIYLGAQEISADANGISFTGNLSGNANALSNIPGANVTGQVPYAAIANSVAGANVNGQVNYAAVANSVAGANVSGTVANATYATNAGSSASANSVAGANVSGQVSFAAVANSVAGANVGGQVSFAAVANSVALSNVSGIGNIASINLDGNVSNLLTGSGTFVAIPTGGGNAANANYANFAGNVVNSSQPNITSVGTLTSLAVTGNITGFANITGDYFLGNGAFLTGVGNFSAALGYHGSFFSNVTQTIASTTTAYPITLNNTSPGTYGVSVTSNSRVTFTYAGTYNIQYSVQFTNTDNAVHNASIWLRKNGVDVPDTNSLFAVTARHGSIDGQLIGAINYIEDVNANDYYELIWQAESTSVSLEYIGPGTTPTSPATPSIIVTAMQVTNVQAATLSGNLTGDLIGNTHGLTGTSFVNIIGNISGNVFTGNGSGLTQLTGANITGAVAFATTANSVALSNVSGAGNIASVNLDGNVSNLLTGSGTFVAIPTVSSNANYANFAGDVVNSNQPNITSLGNLPYLQISNSANANGVINQLSSNNISITTNFSNIGTYQLTTQYHPNNSTGYPGDRTIRSRGNVTTPTTAVNGDRIYQKSGLVYNGTTNAIAVSEVFTAVGTVNANANAAWTGGQWNMSTGNPSGDVGNANALSSTNQLVFTNSGSLQIVAGTPANTSLGQTSSSLVMINYGSSTANLVQVGGLNFQRARGNRDSVTNVLAGDQVGRSVFIAYSNGAYQSANSSQYRVIVDSTYVANDVIVPMNHQIETVANVGGVATFRNYTFNSNGLASFPGNIVTTGTANVGALNVTGITNLGNVGNVTITGGTANYVLSTDGAGNLDWVAQSGGGSSDNISNGTSNVSIPTTDGNINFYANSSLVMTVTDNYLDVTNLRTTAGNVRLGYNSGAITQGTYAIAIGNEAGSNNQGTNSIAIGAYAGSDNQPANSIILNATGASLDTTTPDSFIVKPIRNANTSYALYYDDSTGEITYDVTSGGGGTPGGSTTEIQYNDAGVFGGIANLTYDNTTGNIVMSNANVTFNNFTELANSTANAYSSGNLAFDSALGTVQVFDVAGAITIYNADMVNVASGGSVVMLLNIQSGAEGSLITTDFKFANDDKILSTTIGNVDMICAVNIGGQYYATLTKGYA